MSVQIQQVVPSSLSRRDDLTFRANLKESRYGWLRLTPAYSVNLVRDILAEHSRPSSIVLDPFCGTGTTALACAEGGTFCATTDINPFLVWLAQAKTRAYAPEHVEQFRSDAGFVAHAFRGIGSDEPWVPPLHEIAKWWPPATLTALGRAFRTIQRLDDGAPAEVADLLRLAFCRTLIAHANVSFGHQSMSFRQPTAQSATTEVQVAETWTAAVAQLAASATSPIRSAPSVMLSDARELCSQLGRSRADLVITSPPYPNRMSYIRELRPYMYWLGYLSDGRQAGELDWQAIGGTWGSASSKVAKWVPDEGRDVPFSGFDRIVERVGARSVLLARYLQKYFHDMMQHCHSLFEVVGTAGTIHYVVGNSRYYDVTLPTEQIFAAMFEAVGFTGVRIQVLRKRTSKKELFEFLVSARKPADVELAA